MTKLHPSKCWGVWIRQNRTFYWLETGPQSLSTNNDKLRSILISRGILEYQTEHRLVKNQEPYLQMTLQDAEEKGYKVERVFLNAHIKNIVLERESKTKTNESPW